MIRTYEGTIQILSNNVSKIFRNYKDSFISLMVVNTKGGAKETFKISLTYRNPVINRLNLKIL